MTDSWDAAKGSNAIASAANKYTVKIDVHVDGDKHAVEVVVPGSSKDRLFIGQTVCLGDILNKLIMQKHMDQISAGMFGFFGVISISRKMSIFEPLYASVGVLQLHVSSDWRLWTGYPELVVGRFYDEDGDTPSYVVDAPYGHRLPTTTIRLIADGDGVDFTLSLHGATALRYAIERATGGKGRLPYGRWKATNRKGELLRGFIPAILVDGPVFLQHEPLICDGCSVDIGRGLAHANGCQKCNTSSPEFAGTNLMPSIPLSRIPGQMP